MGYPIKGVNGTGQVTAYTLTANETLEIVTVAWQVNTDASGNGHSAEVIFLTQDGLQISRIPDWNDVGDLITVDYTFGVGLRAFCGIANDGGAIQNDLPVARLTHGCSIIVRSVDATGSVVTGDVLSEILLWAEAPADVEPLAADVIPLYTPVASDEQTGQVAV